ncbi:HD domain-containing protein (plasmid) [Rhizobium leguminosarum]
MNYISKSEDFEMMRSNRSTQSDDTYDAQKLIDQLATHDALKLSLPECTDVRADVDLIYRLYDLQRITRFFGQKHWEAETEYTTADPNNLGLENVAAHSYQVARCALLLAPHFPWLDRAHTTELALLHDEPEIVMGDRDPVGNDGQGSATHAFNPVKRIEKDEDERVAINQLAGQMRPTIRDRYRRLFLELSEGATEEARFVKAVDKLQSLAFVRLKKMGSITPEHAAFTLRYSRLGVLRFPQLQRHFMYMFEDVLRDVASAQIGLCDDFHALTWSCLIDAEKR